MSRMKHFHDESRNILIFTMCRKHQWSWKREINRGYSCLMHFSKSPTELHVLSTFDIQIHSWRQISIRFLYSVQHVARSKIQVSENFRWSRDLKRKLGGQPNDNISDPSTIHFHKFLRKSPLRLPWGHGWGRSLVGKATATATSSAANRRIANLDILLITARLSNVKWRRENRQSGPYIRGSRPRSGISRRWSRVYANTK